MLFRSVFSYDKPTQVAEITDGLANTIAVLQVPPDYKTPWLAGGGSTVRGVPEKDSIKPFVCAEYQGKRGTFAIMANGDVRFVREDIPDTLFQAMVTIAGGEPISKADMDKFAPIVPRPEVEPAAPPAPAGGNTKSPEGGGASGGTRTKLDEAKITNDFRQLGLAYHSCLDANKRPPAKVEDLAPFYENNAALTAKIKDGSYILFWNVDVTKLANGASNTILGYEKDAPTKGGVVAFADGRAAVVTAEEFAKAARPPGQ